MGQLEAVLLLLRMTPASAITRAQRGAIAAALERAAAMLRRT